MRRNVRSCLCGMEHSQQVPAGQELSCMCVLIFIQQSMRFRDSTRWLNASQRVAFNGKVYTVPVKASKVVN